MHPRWSWWVGALALVVVGSACGGDDAAPTPLEVVGGAFEDAAEASSYTVTQLSAQSISSSALGIDTVEELDADEPVLVAELTPAGQHVQMDVARLLGPLAADLGPLVIELWVDADRIVIDSRAFQALLDQSPGAELGPLAPGLSFVDLEQVGAERAGFLTAIAGSGAPDLATIAARLPAALADVEQVSDDPLTFTGSTSFADHTAAMGGDIEVVARSAAAGVALNLDVDPEALADFYVDFYEATRIDVTIVLDADGLVSSVETHADLSRLYTQLFEHGEELGLGFSDRELQEALDAFADTTWTLDTRATFELDDDLVVEPAPDATEDRTDDWRDFLVEAGLLDG
jgi:hypothetical protein